jgi:hypothetical protein
MAKKLHFAWFGAPGAHYWNAPSSGIYDWRRGDLYMDIARLCERAFMDMVLFADIPAVPATYGGSNDHYVEHGLEVHLDPAPILAMMGGVTRHIGLGATLSTSLYPPFLLARMVGTSSLRPVRVRRRISARMRCPNMMSATTLPTNTSIWCAGCGKVGHRMQCWKTATAMFSPTRRRCGRCISTASTSSPAAR